MTNLNSAEQILKRLIKKSNRGFRGYPVIEISFYGEKKFSATKAVLRIQLEEGDEVRHFTTMTAEADIRRNAEVIQEIEKLIIDRKFPSLSISTEVKLTK